MERPSDLPRLYGELSEWWPLLSAPSEYEEEAHVYRTLLLAACEDPPRTLVHLHGEGIVE